MKENREISDAAASITEDSARGDNLTPAEIVKKLDEYIIGQTAGKRAVAVAIRNRWRRKQINETMRKEVMPRNILMIGPTGVGKTEIARRLADLVSAPFVKVEASKYTEVGYHGRDVESMVRDLAKVAVNSARSQEIAKMSGIARERAVERVLDYLLPNTTDDAKVDSAFDENITDRQWQAAESRRQRSRDKLKAKLADGKLDDREIEIDATVSMPFGGVFAAFDGDEVAGQEMQDMLGKMLPERKKTRRVTVAEALRIFISEEAEKMIDDDRINREAITQAEQEGIIFIDEIDKIIGTDKSNGPDVSREGVQRDLLPIVEGCTVASKFGNIKTDHILFIAAGAFHGKKPSDLIPELQGRLPIRVELEPLTRADFIQILTRPKNALVRQYQLLLGAEGLTVEFSDTALVAIAEITEKINKTTDDIGARRLHTVMEKLFEEISFDAPERVGNDRRITVDEKMVRDRLTAISENEDLSRFIL